MPRLKRTLRDAIAERNRAVDRCEREAWTAEAKRTGASGKSIVQVVLKQWTTARGDAARVLLEMGTKRKRLALEVGTEKLGHRKAATHLKQQHSGEAVPTGGYVGVRKPSIDRNRFPLAAAFVDVWWNSPWNGLGRLSVAAVEKVRRKVIAQQWANPEVKTDLERAGRLDVWEAAKLKSGRKS